MGEKLVIGPINKGLRNDRTAFVIDNDSFPVLINAYQWRGRVKRKRGTSLLGRLQRYFNSTSASYNANAIVLTLNGSGQGNILTGFGLQPNGNIIPGSVTLVGSVGVITYTDPTIDGYLTPTGTSGPNTINYATGDILIPAQAGGTITAVFLYYPGLPVMGLEDFITNSTQFSGTLGFDTEYAYNISTAFPYLIYDVSFYKNPITASYASYVSKSIVTPTSWNGQDYQQFWTVNYQGAFWATNGPSVPFSVTNIGMQYKPIVSTTIVAGGPPATVTLQITAHGLSIGDFLFINEVVTTTGINLQTGYVITVTDANNVIVEFPNATIAGAGTGGIAQYLTNRSDTTKDCLRWYDGDPTNGSATSPTLTGNLGWVNFAPPLSNGSYSISDLPAAQYYLVGAKLIVPFKDRLLFFGPVVQTSASNSQVYLKDTVIYSQNGTAYYTSSFTGDPTLATTVFNPILTPLSQTSSPIAYVEDITGFGGYIQAGIDQAINTVSINEDVLLLGFDKQQVRLAYSGNDIIPFNLFIINSELGSNSTFSSIILDKGAITKGSRGFIITSQTQAQRIDLEIPDQVFQINLTNNGNERMCAQRDFVSEWIYFTYPANELSYTFPNQTLQYNYRDQSWAIFNESYTTYGSFRRQTGFTWATVGLTYPTWASWNDPWDSGSSTLLQPEVIAGNQQGFVLFRNVGTNEGDSLYIQSFNNSVVTAPYHCLIEGDYIVISECLGTVGPYVNDKIFSIGTTTENTFVLNPALPSGLNYSGGGLIKRMYVPFIQTKQFPSSWGQGRKTRLGVQQYLFTTTSNGQITLLLFLSQDGNNPYNTGPIVPTVGSNNNSLVYSTVLYTCPESTNLGLTSANVNLQMPTAQQQSQIWHRINTSLLGDTVQIGFTMNDAQMRDTNFNSQFSEVEFHSCIIDMTASSLLA